MHTDPRSDPATVLRRARKFLQLQLPHVPMAKPRATPATVIEKTIWGSPAGKKRLAPRLVKLIPTHKTYVEPFAGSGAVFFAKEPADTEVLSDADPEIAAAFKALTTLTDGELASLKKKDWTGRKTTFAALKNAKPTGKVEKLYRFLYLSHFAYGALRGKSYNAHDEGIVSHTIARIEKHRDRLRGVKVRSGHYAAVVKEFDGKDTFFFLDPPYPGHNVQVGEDRFDEVEFRKVLDSIKGKFLITYGTRGKLDTSGFQVRKIRTRRTMSYMRGVGGPKTLPQLLIANYSLTQKSLGPYVLDEVEAAIELDDATAADLEYARLLAKALSDGGNQPRIAALAQALDRFEGVAEDRFEVLAGALVSIGDRLGPTLEVMAPRTAVVLRDAMPALEELAEPRAAVEKARMIPFQQWGGSAKYARRLADQLPEHKRYVEPFSGAAAVFYAKKPADEEVLADADPEVAFAHRFLQKLDDRAMTALDRLPWKVSRAGFQKVRESKPRSDAERFWKVAYGRLCSYGAKPNLSGYASIHDGHTYDLDELWKFHKRLQGVRIVAQDWKKTLADHDSANTLFFIDPPYEGEWTLGDGIPAEDIAKAVRTLKGQYIVAYTNSAAARRAFGDSGRAFKLRIPEKRGTGKWQKRSRLFIASSGVKKSLNVEWLEPEAATAELPAALAMAFDKRIPLLKTEEERYVLGIVLEPETVDAQKDIYSADEVREAAHRFMQEYRNIGLMHQGLVNSRVKILESYLAPAPFALDGTQIRKGTWLLAVRVLDEALWAQIKAGELGGFSIGGSARSAPA